MFLYNEHAPVVSTDKTIKLWKLSERCKRPEGMNLKDDSGLIRTPTTITTLQVPVFVPVDMMVEASPRRVFANAHAYHINSVSINSDCGLNCGRGEGGNGSQSMLTVLRLISLSVL